MCDIWCPGTINSDVPNTYGRCLVSSYYEQWSTENVSAICCPGTIHSNVPNTYGWCLVSSYYKQWSTENVCLIFGVQVLYTVTYRKPMAYVWCPVIINSDPPKTYVWYLVCRYYTHWCTEHLFLDVWCPGTINNYLPETRVWYFVSSYYKQWSTENLCLIFGVHLLYTVMYRTPMADVW